VIDFSVLAHLALLRNLTLLGGPDLDGLELPLARHAIVDRNHRRPGDRRRLGLDFYTDVYRSGPPVLAQPGPPHRAASLR